MSKPQENRNLQKRRLTSPLLAVSLAASLAALGCTTNHNLGSGAPARSGPGVRTAPTSGITSGSEREAPVVPPPMTSAAPASLPSPSASLTTQRAASRADRAAAILAGNQPARGRYLGVVNPGAATRGYVSQGQGIAVNSSVNLDGVAAIANAAGVTAGTPNEPAVRGRGVATTGALPSGAFASAGSGLVTAAGVINPTVTTAGGLAPAPTVASAASVTPTAVAGGSTLPAVAASGVPSVPAATGVRIVQGTNGVTITNTTSTSTGTTGSN